MDRYTVKMLSKLAGVSVRTIHYYDHIALLKPASRTEAGYRYYGQDELLRLQQILFYKELDFPLKDICDIMEDPAFDVRTALLSHKSALLEQRKRLDTLIATIDKTLLHQIKNKFKKMKPEELYKGLQKEKAKHYRSQAVEKYGKETVETAENSLVNMGKQNFEALKKEQDAIMRELFALVDQDYSQQLVQDAVHRHYINTRKFWGTHESSDAQSEQYTGLGELYVADERFTMLDGEVQVEFASFLQKAMRYFATNTLEN